MKRLLAVVALVASACASPARAEEPTRFAAVGDVGQGNDVQRAVAARIASHHQGEPVDALLLLGDLIYPDGDGADYQAKFAEPYGPVLEAGIPLRAALGNHDVMTRRGADMIEAFEMPARFYEFTIGPVAFFALDSTRMGPLQLRWLRTRLAATAAPWRVLFMHHPPFSSGLHRSSFNIRFALASVVRDFGVQLVLAGHDHDYERTIRLGTAVYVVAGTGCCLRPVGRSWFTAAAESFPGFVVVEADETSMRLKAIDADGAVRDEAVVAKMPLRRAA